MVEQWLNLYLVVQENLNNSFCSAMLFHKT